MNKYIDTIIDNIESDEHNLNEHILSLLSFLPCDNIIVISFVLNFFPLASDKGEFAHKLFEVILNNMHIGHNDDIYISYMQKHTKTFKKQKQSFDVEKVLDKHLHMFMYMCAQNFDSTKDAYMHFFIKIIDLIDEIAALVINYRLDSNFDKYNQYDFYIKLSDLNMILNDYFATIKLNNYKMQQEDISFLKEHISYLKKNQDTLKSFDGVFKYIVYENLDSLYKKITFELQLKINTDGLLIDSTTPDSSENMDFYVVEKQNKKSKKSKKSFNIDLSLINQVKEERVSLNNLIDDFKATNSATKDNDYLKNYRKKPLVLDFDFIAKTKEETEHVQDVISLIKDENDDKTSITLNNLNERASLNIKSNDAEHIVSVDTEHATNADYIDAKYASLDPKVHELLDFVREKNLEQISLSEFKDKALSLKFLSHYAPIEMINDYFYEIKDDKLLDIDDENDTIYVTLTLLK